MSELSRGDRVTNTMDEIIIDDERYRQIAHELWEKNWEAIDDGKYNPSSEHAKILHVLAGIDPALQKRYWGHGVTRGDLESQIAAAISIMENNLIFGDAAPLADSGYADAYTHGSFLVISQKDKPLIEGKTMEERGKQRVKVKRSDGSEKVAIRINPGAFVCNAAFGPLVDKFRELFPNANILRADELAGYLKEQDE